MSIIDGMVKSEIVVIEIRRRSSSPGITRRVEAVTKTKVVGKRKEGHQLLYRSSRVEARPVEIPVEYAYRLYGSSCRSRTHGISRQIHSGNSRVCVSILNTWEEAKVALPGLLRICDRSNCA